MIPVNFPTQVSALESADLVILDNQLHMVIKISYSRALTQWELVTLCNDTEHTHTFAEYDDVTPEPVTRVRFLA